MKFKFKSCYAEGDRCHGCDHYKGKAPICIYAPKQVDEGEWEMKDTVTYPLSAITGDEEESRIDQLERELAEANARLDWLDTVECGIFHKGYGEYRYYIGDGFTKKAREVIDAAMKECWK